MHQAPSIPHAPAKLTSRFALSCGFLVVLSIAWAFLLSEFQEGNVYEVMGPFALVVLGFIVTRQPSRTLQLLKPTWYSAGVGLGVGAAMTAVVYPAYTVVSQWLPSLRTDVQVLYAGAEQGLTYTAIAWLLVIIAAEEALWRGRCLRVLSEQLPLRWAAALSLLAYTAAQLGTGSWLVAALALVCGAFWMSLRVHTGTLVAPLLSHLVFTLTVLVAYPVA